jgi:hypothetical protein
MGHPATASKVRPNAGFVGRHECAKYCDGSKAFSANCETLGVSTWKAGYGCAVPKYVARNHVLPKGSVMMAARSP